MAKEDAIELSGVVLEALPDAKFKLKLENGFETLGFLSGKMKQNMIRVLPGDKVKVEMTPYDLTKARIVFREK